MNKLFKTMFGAVRKLTGAIYDQYEELTEQDTPKGKIEPQTASIKEKKAHSVDAICKKTIIVGKKVPNEVSIVYKGGVIFLNLGSTFFDFTFQKELKKLKDGDYEFSHICRDALEQQAFYNAIKKNVEREGEYSLIFVD